MPLAVINTASAGDNTIVAATAGKRVRVKSFQVINQVATAQAVKLKDGASTDLMTAEPLPLAVGMGIAAEGPPEPQQDWLFQTSPGNALVLNLSAATAVTGEVVYSLES